MGKPKVTVLPDQWSPLSIWAMIWSLVQGAGAVILTLGERGSLLATEQQRQHIPAKKVKILDSTGAGDAFIGSLAYFVAAGKTLPEAVRRANDIAAISVQAPGTQSSFPNAADLPAELLE